MISRRALFGLASGGLLLPRRTFAAAPERRFLFVLANGGWDTTRVFTPKQDDANVATESDATVAEANGIAFVDHSGRASVRNFFGTWGGSTAVINGIEVRSVTHERCRRILLTGSSGAAADDWPSTIAARSSQDLLLPHLVVYGPAFNSAYTDRVVRVGNEGQLPTLLDGTALTQSGPTLAAFSQFDAAADARVAARAAAFAASAGRGRAQRFGEGYAKALSTLDRMDEIAAQVSLTPTDAGCARDLASDAAAAFDCFSLGLSRCAMVRYDGWCSAGWDTHANNDLQSTHFELLFYYLNQALADLAGRTSFTGGSLADEVVIVVLSEMGRHPRLNANGGKDHWTYTSAMLVGAGVQGGRVVGELNDDFQGSPIDLASGELDEAGTGLLPSHLGATLLAMADIDPAEVLSDDAQPIAAVMA